jgi:hypothetical protein
MGLLTADQILGADDLVYEDVEVPEWGGSIRIRTMTAAARDTYEASIMEVDEFGNVSSKVDNMRAKLVARCAIDEDGKPLFSEAQIAELGQKSAKALQTCFNVAARLNAVTDSDIEELAGNS